VGPKEAPAKAEGIGIASQHIRQLVTTSKFMLHSFEFVLGKKSIVGALAIS